MIKSAMVTGMKSILLTSPLVLSSPRLRYWFENGKRTQSANSLNQADWQFTKDWKYLEREPWNFQLPDKTEFKSK